MSVMVVIFLPVEILKEYKIVYVIWRRYSCKPGSDRRQVAKTDIQ